MDGGIGGFVRITDLQRKTCLNPCFDGWWYRSDYFRPLERSNKVLILVLMDGGIGEQRQKTD